MAVTRVFFKTIAATCIAAGVGLAVIFFNTEAEHPITQHVYVWQRIWNDALMSSIKKVPTEVTTIRILAAEFSENGTLSLPSIRHSDFSAINMPIVLVFRINGQLDVNVGDGIATRIQHLHASLQKLNSHVAGIEIDHDCATAKLHTYLNFLRTLKNILSTDTILSITALPAWLEAQPLADIVALVDHVVLQVHSVQSPQKGLFDEKVALDWVKQYAHRFKKPFYVALPNYGLKVSFDQTGKVTAIESEQHSDEKENNGNELMIDPRAVSRVMAELRKIDTLAGVVWFRLPLESDRRIWRYATWVKVVKNEPLTEQTDVQLRPVEGRGGYDVNVVNTGDIDTLLPKTITIDEAATCESYDAVNGYEAEKKAGRITFTLPKTGYIKATTTRAAGWLHCAKGSNPHVLTH